jgi:5-methylcytosine-specific restriction endonuclease McrA
MGVSNNKQIDFIAYIQRLLVEGEFNATYKYALLHALADICIESPLMNDPNHQLQIPLSTIVEKFIAIYWQHAMPFNTTEQNKNGLLQQNSGKQAKIITELNRCHNLNIKNINKLKQSDDWSAIYKDTLRVIKEGPLWRLQLLAKKEECFLYAHKKGVPYIMLNQGIAYCFRRFYELVTQISRNAWINKIQSIPANQQLIGNQAQLDPFLFGINRQTITQARPILEEIQKGKCFYCQKKLTQTTEVDHFIPFAKYANDLGHNFVAAHSSCNNNKRDYLAGLEHRDRWFEQNIINNQKILDDELSGYFNCDAKRSESITIWAYQIAAQNKAQLWLGKGTFESTHPEFKSELG